MDYIKFVFSNAWRKGSLTTTFSSISSLYAMILICVYVAFSFTELTRFPNMIYFLERHGFFIYLYLVSVIYFLYLICYVVSGTREEPLEASSDLVKVIESRHSHGSFAVRFGAVIFGIGTMIHFSLEMITFTKTLLERGPCFNPIFVINVVLAATFTVLQIFVIFTYPRLNVHCHQVFNRFASMHVVACNIIVWVRTLIKESIEEIIEFEEEKRRLGPQAGDSFRMDHLNDDQCYSLLRLLEKDDKMDKMCRNFSLDQMGGYSAKTSSYLYPFVIEFALIGASMANIMCKNIGLPTNLRGRETEINRVRKPHPINFLRKVDWSHSIKGVACGCFVLFIAVVNLVVFFRLDVYKHTKDEAELISKASNTVINSVGIIACVFGIAEIQQLSPKDQYFKKEGRYDLDNALLKFGSGFSFVYLIFTIITGAFSNSMEYLPNALHIANGVVGIVQIVLQIVFIRNLKEKTMPVEMKELRPGREISIFLFLFNISQWLVLSFEIQKVQASPVEANFYGFMPWIIIQRVTLPLAVFFRFHSSVVCIELWKSIYFVRT